MTKLSNPVPVFFDQLGELLDGGYIYIGAPNADPQSQPLDIFWDIARTIPAAQPLRTAAGRIVNGATPASVFFAEADFSSRVLDANEALVDYQASTFLSNASFQPLDQDLSAIATAGTTAYGITLLSLANQDALKTAAGTANALQKSGGTMTAAIYRQNAGVYIHWADASYTGDTIYVTEAEASNPTVAPGDLWFTLQ